jgi:deazaflavin-dependent oxidoreductase (nitroreductase family)
MDIAETNRRVITQFRAGAVEGMDRDRLLLLTTTGRRTGKPRTTPMMFHREGEQLVIIASNNGAARHPDWYHNLLADPHVTVEIGDRRYPAAATTSEAADREQLWTAITATYPFFADHQAGIERTIPLVILTEAG